MLFIIVLIRNTTLRVASRRLGGRQRRVFKGEAGYINCLNFKKVASESLALPNELFSMTRL